jgi:peptide-methionine (S)-S-oxide reductase
MRSVQSPRLARRVWPRAVVLACLVGTTASARFAAGQGQPAGEGDEVSKSDRLDLATFANGCFWCTEALFDRVKGVKKVVSGYSGGTVENPTYKQVCTGQTGHAEAVQITFDPAQVSYADLLEIFWKTHDPTTLNQQGPDVGTQYRSAVFYHNDEQKKTAETYKRQLDESKTFQRPIVTEITEYASFYPAENYHQDYFERNSRQPYCRQQISPKIKKFNRMFRDKLKDEDKGGD